MSASSDYLSALEQLATNAYKAKQDQLTQQLTAGASGTFTTDATGKATGYTPGTTGVLDVAYGRGKERLAAGSEASGTLRSGQAAIGQQNLLTDYTQSVMDLYNSIAGQRAANDAAYQQQLAEYRAKYGTKPEPTAPTIADTANQMTLPPGTSTAVPSASFVPAPQAAAPRINQATRTGVNLDQQLGQTLFGATGPWTSTNPDVQAGLAAAFNPPPAPAPAPRPKPKPAAPPKPVQPPKPAAPPKPTPTPTPKPAPAKAPTKKMR